MKRIAAATLLIIATLGLAACSASGGSLRSSTESGSSSRSGSSSGAVTVLNSARAVITTGTISITAEKPSAAAEAAVHIANAAGGHVDGRDERPPSADTPGSARLVLRLPGAQLDAAITALKKLGRVDKVSISTQDVTGQSTDLGARITALTTSVSRLTELMARATTTADLIAIETTLSDRQAKVESLQLQKRDLDDRVDLATVTVKFSSTAAAPVHPPETFLSGLIVGWGSITVFFAGVLVLLGVALPWLALAALLAGVTGVVVRRRRARPVHPS